MLPARASMLAPPIVRIRYAIPVCRKPVAQNSQAPRISIVNDLLVELHASFCDGIDVSGIARLAGSAVFSQQVCQCEVLFKTFTTTT